ncbi:MAG TPA: glycosyltransferase [Blastocatellia bacterium]|nr:glycosyltransferase [Blastocatellia bacterium]
MKPIGKPKLLILTSSFPRDPNDETCGYIRDFARSLAPEFSVQVLAPPDKEAGAWPQDAFTLTRSNSPLPIAIDPFQASADLNCLTSGSIRVKLAACLSLLAFFLTAFRLARRADVICSHWMLPSGFIGSLLSRLLARPHTVIEHSGALHLLMRMRGGRFLVRFIIRGSHRVITVSRNLKERLLALCPDAAGKIETIPMGITCAGEAKRLPQTDGEQTILFVGRLCPIKGVPVLLKAAERLNGARVIIAGDGESRAKLEAMARRLSVKATFLGRIDAAQRERLFSLCDVAVIPSLALPDGRTEGRPVVCLEVMAAGLPVIASRTGGLAEIITDGYNGLLFAPGDDRMLSEKLQLVLSDSNLRQALARNACRTAEGHDWRQIGPRYAEIIHSSMRSDGNIYSQRINARVANG